MKERWFCHATEYERGWGQKDWEVSEWDTKELAKERVRHFNDQNKEREAPDWYVSAHLSRDLNLLRSKEYVDCRKKEKPRIRVKAVSVMA